MKNGTNLKELSIHRNKNKKTSALIFDTHKERFGEADEDEGGD